MAKSKTTFVILATGVVLLLLSSSSLRAQQAFFKRGDVNVDERFNITDAVVIAERLFVSGEEFPCEDSADVNDDGRLNLTDVILAASYLFLDVDAPPPPLLECGEDPTEDALVCDQFPPCGFTSDICFDDALLEELFADVDLELGLEICLPAGLLEIPVETFEISVCPEAAAQPECGELEEPGCPIEITSITPILDLDAEHIGLRVTGRIEDLPIDVTAPIFGTTTCLNTFHAEGDDDAPFSFDIIIPLIVEEVEPGVREIIGLGENSVENIDMELTASGGIVCTLFGALDDVLIDLFLLPLGEAVAGITDQIADGLTGLRLCDEE